MPQKDPLDTIISSTSNNFWERRVAKNLKEIRETINSSPDDGALDKANDKLLALNEKVTKAEFNIVDTPVWS